MSVRYSQAENNIFISYIPAFRNSIYSCINEEQMLIAAEQFATYIKATEPSINPNRSENAILIHFIYLDNLLAGVQPRYPQRDSGLIKTKTRSAAQITGLNPLTTKDAHYLL